MFSQPDCLCWVLTWKAKSNGESFSQTWLKSTELFLCYGRIMFLSLPSTTWSEIPPWPLCVSERAKPKDGNAVHRKHFCVAHQQASLSFQRDLIWVKFDPMVNKAYTFLPKLSYEAWAPRAEIGWQRYPKGATQAETSRQHCGVKGVLSLVTQVQQQSSLPFGPGSPPCLRPSGDEVHPSAELMLQALYREITALPFTL